MVERADSLQGHCFTPKRSSAQGSVGGLCSIAGPPWFCRKVGVPFACISVLRAL